MQTQADNQTARANQLWHSQHYQHGQHQKALPVEQSSSCATGENPIRRSSVRRSGHHRHQHGSQHHSEASSSRRHSHTRRNHLTLAGDNHEADKSQYDATDSAKEASAKFSLADAEDGMSVAPTSTGTAPQSLVDQLLINLSSSKFLHTQTTPTKAAVAVTTLHRRSRKPLHHQLVELDSAAPGQQSLTATSCRSSSQFREVLTEPSLVADIRTSSRQEAFTGKALAKQWLVSKQFVIANCINCLSQRMRDLQQTEEPVLAQQKLLALRQLRQLTDSVRRINLTKQLYSTGRRAKQATAAVGLRSDSLSADLLRRWSSRENEYHMYWMALLEKSAVSLANCHDVAALQQQLKFAMDLVDVHGLPLR